MREIKVRAWLKKEKRFIEVCELRYNMKGNMSGIRVKEKNGPIDCDLFFRSLILMQSTGLYDKNGEEIYEGDIVRFNNHICSVDYTMGSFALVSREYIERPDEWSALWIDNVVPLCEIMWNCSEFEDWIDEVEVIGNIYENPELLEVDK